MHADTHEDCDFDDPEILLEGVTIELLDADGNVVATTTTDANGEYRFDGLQAGEYRSTSIQPTGYYDGGERVGSVGGQLRWHRHDLRHSPADPGTACHQYDFCEKVGVMLSGNVYHDRTTTASSTATARTKASRGVVLKLLDASGNDTGLRATTDAHGFYKFNNLAAGKYSVMEVHPSGWLDGMDTPGNLGGVADVSPPGDMISQIMINWGEMGTEYNFGELLPGSITGRIHADDGPDCDFDDPHHMLEGVQVDLLDGQGNVIASTFTNAARRVLVHRLAAGNVQRARASAGGVFRRRRARRLGRRCRAPTSLGFYSIFTGIKLGSGVNAIQVRLLREAGGRAVRLRVHRRRADCHRRSAHAGANRRASRRPANGRRHAARRRCARIAAGPDGRTDLGRQRNPGLVLRRCDRSDSRHDRRERLSTISPACRPACMRSSKSSRRT